MARKVPDYTENFTNIGDSLDRAFDYGYNSFLLDNREITSGFSYIIDAPLDLNFTYISGKNISPAKDTNKKRDNGLLLSIKNGRIIIDQHSTYEKEVTLLQQEFKKNPEEPIRVRVNPKSKTKACVLTIVNIKVSDPYKNPSSDGTEMGMYVEKKEDNSIVLNCNTERDTDFKDLVVKIEGKLPPVIYDWVEELKRQNRRWK